MRARKTAKICFIYLFFLCFFFFLPIYDDYDMMRFLAFSLSCLLYGGGGKAVWFGLGG